MTSLDGPGADSGVAAIKASPAGAGEFRSAFTAYARRYRKFLFGLLIAAFVSGIAYRYLFDPYDERELANFIRSGFHAMGLALGGWTVQLAFVSIPRSRLGAALRKLPLWAEFVVKSIAMTAAFTAVAVILQIILYGAPPQRFWFEHELPNILSLAFVFSLFVGMLFELQRFIGGRVLGSFLLGTYRRPTREQRIVMFLDIAGSTTLAENMDELRVHDLITRFFYDIDGPIADHGGEVHSYVGDEVIVTWPQGGDPKRNAGCLRCFFAIEDKIARVASSYVAEFGVAPRFRAGLHAGPVIVSQCGELKRQLAYFGDTMNVAARLREHCKAAGELLIVSAELMHCVRVPPGLKIGSGGKIPLRGRRIPIEAHSVRREE